MSGRVSLAFGARSAAVPALLVVLALTGVSVAAAQTNGASIGALEGTVRDSAGQPIEKASVCTIVQESRGFGRAHCGRPDSTGAYHVDSLPASRLGFTVTCAGVRPFDGRVVASDSLQIQAGSQAHRDWIVSRAGCDPRPLRRVAGTFRGHYTSGFEASKFVPCAADAWFIPGDSLGTYLYDARLAWARLQPTVARQGLVWPEVPRDVYGSPRFYVRWRATVIGPGHYGHMGVSPFQIWVDSLLELRAPSARDCS